MNSQSLWLALGVALLLGAAIFLFGGTQPTEVSEPAPATTVGESVSAPVTVVQPSPAALRVDVGEDWLVSERTIIELDPVIAASTGTLISVRWSAEGGLGFFSDRNRARTTYTAPSACDCEDTVTLTLTATTSSGAVATDSLVVRVRDPLACPTETYDVSGAWIVVPADLCHVHERAGCPEVPAAACESPCITDAPVDSCNEVAEPCPCEGDCGPIWGSEWPEAPQGTPLHGRDRPKPLIDRQYPKRIAENQIVELQGFIKNPACQPVCFVWLASKGRLENAHTLQPTYYAPESERADGERVSISLVIYDRSGSRSYDQIRMDIDNLDYVGP